MGRTMLIVIILMGTIYTGIIGGLQERLLYIPKIITRNIIRKQAESVSDYALRLAIKEGNYLRTVYIAEDDTSSHVYTYTGANLYQIQDSTIDSIRFTFKGRTGVGENIIKQYLATSYVTGQLMGETVPYQAKVAYELSANKQFENIYYNHFTMDSKCWKGLLEDESGEGNHAILIGKNVKSNKSAAQIGDSSAEFNTKGSGVGDSFMYHMENQLQVTDTYTLSTWLILPKDVSSKGIVAWVPPRTSALGGASNYVGPYSGAEYISRPTAAIYYEDGTLYFEANTADGQRLLLTTSISRTQNTNKLKFGSWTHVAMTYDSGIMKAYKSGELVGTIVADSYPIEAVENWGIFVGARPTNPGADNTNATNIMIGLMDDLAFSPYVLDSDVLGVYYLSIATPPKILYFRD
ncbi:MAG: hypothetical protein PWP64_1631 [Candidatus Cloacimonadota bacterium]|nr:hypothetical protein [Candidatus Cloacimonadota bacterium]